MTNYRKVFSCAVVAAFAFAASASATTVLVTDQFGSNIAGGTMLVQPMGNDSLSNMVPSAIEARELNSGGYVVNVSGPATIEFTHPAYGTLESKAIFGTDAIELVLGAEGRGYALKHAGMDFDTSAPSATRNNCGTADPLDYSQMIVDGVGLTVTATTSGNDANVNCGISGSDWIGSWTATTTQNLNFTTCLAANGAPLNLDTILQVRTAANCASGPSIACDDDSCPGAPGFTFNSILNNVPMTTGTSYVVIVDRWASTLNMTFDLHIEPPFELDPPEGGCIDENEPNCGLAPVGCSPDDFTNGGCNFTPALFSEVACGDTYCSTYGNCGSTRDTDWYRYQETSIRVVDWCCIGEGLGLYGQVASGHTFGSECPATAFAAFATASPGVEVCVTGLTFPGSWLFFGATSNFSGQPCGLEYQCTLNCTCPAPCDGDGGASSAGGSGEGNFSGGDAARARY